MVRLIVSRLSTRGLRRLMDTRLDEPGSDGDDDERIDQTSGATEAIRFDLIFATFDENPTRFFFYLEF